MERRILGKIGDSVSAIGFGGSPIGLFKTPQQDVTRILNTLLDSGVNLIDTAASYENSEQAIGKAISHRRNEYFLVTKCGPRRWGAWTDKYPSELADDIDRSLVRLKTEYIDLLLLHSCDLETLKRFEVIEPLIKARDAGKVRHLGYAGDNEAAAYAAHMPDISALEITINLCDHANIRNILPLAKKYNLGVIAKRPVANTAWKPLYEQPPIFRIYCKEYSRRFASMRLNTPIGSWLETAIRFTLSQDGVHTAIIGTTNIDHAISNIQIASKGLLPDITLDKIYRAFEDAESKSPDPWLAET